MKKVKNLSSYEILNSGKTKKKGRHNKLKNKHKSVKKLR